RRYDRGSWSGLPHSRAWYADHVYPADGGDDRRHSYRPFAQRLLLRRAGLRNSLLLLLDAFHAPHLRRGPFQRRQRSHQKESVRCVMAQRVLILGGGFGGLYTALELEKQIARGADLEVTLVNRDNFFLFTPMLHEVAASDLDATNIVNPIHK